ncbi:MAG: hypothetical protein KJ077_20055 [Anaerolineae bacterium]|nr:hypothetical protein [Anaerolineae bacterium]
MTKSNQSIEAKHDKKIQHKQDHSVQSEEQFESSSLFDDITENLVLGSQEKSAHFLGNPNIPVIQRQEIAKQIDRVQGNLHLQQVLAAVKRYPLSSNKTVAHGQVDKLRDPTTSSWLIHQHIDTHEPMPIVQRNFVPTVMRSQLFTSTMEICHHLLESRVFRVSEGGIRVTANAVYKRNGTPECSNANFHMTLYQKGIIFDSEYGSGEFPQGRPFSRQWTNLPNGEYYLTIWTNNTNPYCCLVGDIVVEQESGLQGPSCTQAPPSPLEILHTALDLAGLIPVLGVAPDAVNAGVYLIEGNWTNAGLAAVAIIPIFGEAATIGKIGTRTVIRVTGEGIERVGRESIEAGLKEARTGQRAAGPATEGATYMPQQVDPEIDNAIENAFEGGHVTSGEPLELLGHGTARRGRQVRGQSGRQVESTHFAPQSAMRGLASYDPNAALTRLLPRRVHRSMDRFWQERARQLVNQGRTSWTAQEMFEAVAESIRRTPELSDGEKISHIQRLSDEIFVEYGLHTADLVRLPFS